MKRPILLFFLAITLSAASLEVHSEFLRVNPQGEILSVDSTPKPREIISPAVMRNSFASFHIVVRSDHPTSYFLFAASNPSGYIKTNLYKEGFVNRDGDWIPDTLTPLKAPNFGAIPDGEQNIPGQTACVYLLDVWIPPDTPSGTIRVEVQLKVGVWIVAPLELRIYPPLTPEIRHSDEPLPELELRADEAVIAPFVEFMGRHGEGPGTARPKPAPASSEPPAPRTVREAIRRNAEQDMALARLLDAKSVVPALKEKMSGSGGVGEWYLGVRDLIYRLSAKTARKN